MVSFIILFIPLFLLAWALVAIFYRLILKRWPSGKVVLVVAAIAAGLASMLAKLAAQAGP